MCLLISTRSGKVRELYEVNECTLLMVVTDRVSAYDKVLFNGISDKGTILCQISGNRGPPSSHASLLSRY